MRRTTCLISANEPRLIGVARALLTCEGRNAEAKAAAAARAVVLNSWRRVKPKPGFFSSMDLYARRRDGTGQSNNVNIWTRVNRNVKALQHFCNARTLFLPDQEG